MAKTPRSISLVVACVGLVAIAAWVIVTNVTQSGDPGRYYQYRNSAEGFVYPTREVITWSAVVAGELALALAFLGLARRTSPGVRLLTVGLLHGVGFFSLMVFAMHAPPYFTGHIVWLLFASAWSIVTAIAAAIEKRVRA